MILFTLLAVFNTALAARGPLQATLEQIGNDELQRIQQQNIKVPPNFNKVITVPGMDDGSVRFFTEVEDRKPEDPLIIYLHGGAYMMGMMANQAQVLTSIYNDAGAKNRLSIAWVDYTLSTSQHFPQQLTEAANVYSVLQKTSKNIILLGDSAGVHLAVSLMRHLNNPVANVPAVPAGAAKPSAAVLISPWLQLHVDMPVPQGSSWDTNRNKDYLMSPGVNMAGRMLIRDNSMETFLNMYQDKSVPWSAVLPDRSQVLITVGEHEILRDSVESFFEVSGIKNSGGALYMEPGGQHDSPAALGPDRTTITTVVNNFLTKYFARKHGSRPSTADTA